jgi:diguanylate cyclase (GGDEF)-like protein
MRFPVGVAPVRAFDAWFVQQDQVLIIGVAALLCCVGALALAAVLVLVKDRRRRADEARCLRDLADISADGLLICEGETVLGMNRSLERILGRTSQETAGQSICALLPGFTIDKISTTREADAHLACPKTGRIPVRVLRHQVTVGKRRHVVIAVRDQRERLRDDAKMMRLAHQDSLTRLANRLHFTETLAGRFLLPRCGEDSFALLMLDLDRFKAVNDTLGHGMGDELLRRVAVRLTRAVREDDLIARLGGDEFAVLASVGDDLAQIRAIAENILDLVSRPFVIDGHVIEVSTSIGIALAPSDGDEPAQLSRSADLALYRAKEEGGGYRFFDPEMNLRAQARRSLELDLRRAVARGELEVYYQPQVDTRTGAYDGAEALVRWKHPQRGMVSPGDFIPLAEEIGLIGSIGDWVLRTACAEAVKWPEHLSVAVNLSPVQLRDARLVPTVAAVLAETGLPGSRLEIEVTESALLQDNGNTLSTLNALRALGIRISMDDFGTGYSSLSYLRRFPFDKIKIDQSFIRQIPADPDSVAIVQAVASLGMKLGMSVTAEGVETLEQRSFTSAEGCDQIQGYLISRPVPASQARNLFSASVATELGAV